MVFLNAVEVNDIEMILVILRLYTSISDLEYFPDSIFFPTDENDVKVLALLYLLIEKKTDEFEIQRDIYFLLSNLYLSGD